MPYIKQEDRVELDTGKRGPETPGELAYIVFLECQEYLDKFDMSYTLWNDVVGVLRNTELELYRRNDIPGYEDMKIEENGDVI